ncbi:MAG: HAD family hydrolase [Gammaproteobacteria bacterium]|nr:MAG: HAD family hydrolase [Gammaproteobacteria bacterium]
MNPQLQQRANAIRLFVMDVDGVLTTGGICYTANGDELKTFNIRDGLGIKLLQRAGIETAIITGRNSTIVERRAKELGIRYLFQGKEDKRQAFADVLAQAGVSAAATAYIGDDLPDLPLVKLAGLGMTVADGDPRVCAHADWISSCPGGCGAVREAAEMILSAQGKLAGLLHAYE